MSSFQELKRRNVFRAATLYVVTSWLILQVADLFVDRLDVPSWSFRALLGLLILGLPFFLVFSWAYEMTPAGIRRQSEVDRAGKTVQRAGRRLDLVVVAVLILGICVALAARLMPKADDIASEAATRRALGAPAPQDAAPPMSIAVLPFVNMSSDPEQGYFSDGLSEELLNLLAKVPQLRVTSRTSAFSFKGQSVDLRTVARQLNVAHVLEGSVRKSGDRVRITAQLVDAQSDVHVWSQTYDRALVDVFAVQDEIAAAVAGALKVTLLGDSTPTSMRTDPQAYTRYLQAKEMLDAESADGRAHGLDLLHQSLAIAPDYAPAWTLMGRAYAVQAYLGEIPLLSGLTLARGAIQKALLADPQYGPAHARLAGLERDYDWDFVSARAHLQTALALAPTDSVVLRETMKFLTTTGRIAQSAEIAHWVLVRDPVSVDALGALASTQHLLGQDADAEGTTRQILALKPDASMHHYIIGETRLTRGDVTGALEEFEKEPVELVRKLGLALAYHGLGRKAESDAILAEFSSLHPDWSIAIAELCAYRGEIDAAFRWLDRGFVERDPGMPQLRTDPLLKPLHDDPRWPKLLDRIGLSDAQVAVLALNVELP